MSRTATALPRITPKVREREAEAVHLYAKIHALKAELKELEEEGRELATELFEGYGLTSLQGSDGSLSIKMTAGAERLDSAKVRQILTPAQLDAVTVVGASTLRISFTPRREE